MFGQSLMLQSSTFLDKEYILISSRYQLHPASTTTQCPSGNTDAHSQKKFTENKKPRYSEKFLVAATLTPPRQHQKSNISRKQRLQEGNSALTPSSSDHRS
jgi:hypothetical protein